jgi:hypothetical protein
MDPSTSPVQSTSDAQYGGRVQPPASTLPPGSMSQSAPQPVVQSVPTPQTISVHPEQAPVQTGSSQTEESEDLVQPARQEVSKGPGVQQAAEVQEIEVAPSMPELKVEQSVEHVVEKAPDQDKPKIPEEVKAVGVTHSGPGIPVDENVFNVKSLPMTYEQAVAEVKEHPKLNDSKHWLGELIKYVWRKLDPMIGKKKGTS